MSYIPAWQTEELGEEWVETSPSPPGSPEAPPQQTSKRGSLRSLGAGVARPLPPSRKASASTPAPEFGRSPSNPYMRSASGMLSPPTSASGSEGDLLDRDIPHGTFAGPPPTSTTAFIPPPNNKTFASEPPAGTFLVKDGEDSYGKAFPKNPFQHQKDMFSKMALETMFEPPSPHASMSVSALPTLEPISASPSPPPQLSEDDRSASPRSWVGSSEEGTVKSRASEPDADASPVSTTRSGNSSSSGQTLGKEPRRVSHQYAPVHPSRLSKSVTPSDSSFATTTEATQDTFNTSSPVHHVEDSPTIDYHTHAGETMLEPTLLEGPTVDYHTMEPSTQLHEHPETDPETTPEDSPRGTACELPSANPSPERSPEHGSEHDYERGSERDYERSPSPDHSHSHSDADSPLKNPKYPFTFTAPVPHITREPPVFDPSLAPLQTGEPSSSTLRALPNNGLRLFRNTYDTYTREQLSALVDSIAVQPSPSPPTIPPTKLRQWSPADTESPLRSNSSGSVSTPASGSSENARVAKRLRISPQSPDRTGTVGRRLPPSPRGPAVVRDWQAHGRALMDRIRVTDPEVSATSESMSGTSSWESNSRFDHTRSAATPFSDGASGYEHRTYEYSASPVGPAIFTTSPSQAMEGGGGFRSNPSTASSTYLHRAEDMMSRIKSRVVSPSTSTTVESPRFPRRHLSESSRETYTNSDAEPRHLVPQRMVVQPPTESTESDDSKDMSLEESGDEAAPLPRSTGSGSRASVEGAGLPSHLPVNRDDLNRFMSASTYMTGTTISTSFVKHAGPKDAAQQPAMTHIRPGDVPDAFTDRLNGMRFDRKTNRWVRDVSGGLGRVDEAGESRAGASEESIDVFAGIESIHSGERTRGSSMNRSLPRSSLTRGFVAPIMDETDTSAATDAHEDVEVEDDHLDVDRTPRPAALQRPQPQHANTAPAALTPAALKTPSGSTGPGTPGVLRSALRNANSTPASAMKRAAWHPDLTPAPVDREGSAERSVSHKRSVSFSDNYIAPPRSAGGSINKKTAGDLFESTNEASYMPSARTKRIEQQLAAMADELSLEDSTPCKPPRALEPSKPLPGSDRDTTEDTLDEDTVEPMPFGNRSMRSFRRGTGNRADATFLTECSFGVAHDRLVELITDVQPFEPYWEQLRAIDLSSKGVESLVRLKEFLPQLDEANLENNAIAYLSGIPNTVRTLHVAGNALSSLTSVNHLRNLQYLDISRNQLDSVGQLECLRHLRELKADHNAITDISGIMGMDSLLKLSVSGNKIEAVSLETAKWDRLESLNLSHNQITTVTGLHRLKALTSLNLDNNKLADLEPAGAMQSVRSLRFCDNDISHIDLSLFPKLRTLFADSNALPGLSRSLPTGGHRIENLSIRNQRVGALSLSAEDLQSVKRLYVSGNRLETDFLPRTPLFHLVYLEAAACNLTAWPERFSARAPNLRILNVNYNFLDDLDGLAGMQFLRKLMAVGNRLGGGGPAAVRGLDGLGALEEVDLRMNPSTLSFYLPIMLPSKTSDKSTKQDGAAAGAVRHDANWGALDTQFRRQLPDVWYSRRLVYRGLVMAACPDLRVLDAIRVEDGERRKAALLLQHAQQQQQE